MNNKFTFNEDFFTKEEAAYKSLLEFEGESKNNLAHGYGKLIFSNRGIKYDGFFKNGLIDGYGKMYNNGKIVSEGYYYKGEEVHQIKLYNDKEQLWIEAVKSSINYDGDDFIGKVYYENGKVQYFGVLKFESELVENDFIFNGNGKYYFENGQLEYEGEFWNGYKKGRGKLYDSDGILIKDGEFDEYNEIFLNEDENFDYSEEGVYWAEGDETEDEFWEHE